MDCTRVTLCHCTRFAHENRSAHEWPQSSSSLLVVGNQVFEGSSARSSLDFVKIGVATNLNYENIFIRASLPCGTEGVRSRKQPTVALTGTAYIEMFAQCDRCVWNLSASDALMCLLGRSGDWSRTHRRGTHIHADAHVFFNLGRFHLRDDAVWLRCTCHGTWAHPTQHKRTTTKKRGEKQCGLGVWTAL